MTDDLRSPHLVTRAELDDWLVMAGAAWNHRGEALGEGARVAAWAMGEALLARLADGAYPPEGFSSATVRALVTMARAAIVGARPPAVVEVTACEP